MVALAEPKKKTKWTLNPRGKFWSNDDAKLGQKLLEKMGWSKGKGLGKAEQGDVDPIRLSYNTDSKGMGFKGDNDEWVATKEEFDSLLGQLKESHAEDAASADSNADSREEAGPSRPSLEVRSKHSRVRVHYHKFVRGKDLSRYSAEDLSCILGNKKTKSKQKNTSEDDNQKEDASELGAISKSHGVTTIQGGNLNEYFASKMAKLSTSANSTVNSASNSKAASEDEVLDEAEKPVVKKRRKSVIFNEEALVEEFVFNKHSPLEKKKKRKKTEESDASDEAAPEPSKKKKKLPVDDVTNSSKIETANQENVDQNYTKGMKNKTCLVGEDITPISEATDNQEGEPSKKKKKKKDKYEKEEYETNTAEDQQTSEVGEKKKKKYRDVEENVEVISITETSERKKKKKEREICVSEDQQPLDVGESTTKEEQLLEGETNNDVEPTKKKKRKKDAVVGGDSTGIGNITESSEQLGHEDQPDETCSVPKKEKKKKGKSGNAKVMSPTADIDNNINEMLESLDAASNKVDAPISTLESCESSSKKKKKKKTKEEGESTERKQESSEAGDSVRETAQEEDGDGAAKGKKTKKSTSETFNQRAQFKLKDFVPKAKKDAVQRSVAVPVPAAPMLRNESSQQPSFEYLKTSGVKPEALQKIHSLYRQARFDLFVGANLDFVRGYGY